MDQLGCVASIWIATRHQAASQPQQSCPVSALDSLFGLFNNQSISPPPPPPITSYFSHRLKMVEIRLELPIHYDLPIHGNQTNFQSIPLLHKPTLSTARGPQDPASYNLPQLLKSYSEAQSTHSAKCKQTEELQ